MKDGGYFKVYRRAFRDVEHGGDELWNEQRTWSRAEAWMYLLAIAAHADHDKAAGGRILHVRRGEFVASLRFLARKWGWSKNKVAKFLGDLENPLGRVERKGAEKRDTFGDTYLIGNFDYYQSGRDSKRDSDGTATGQRRDKVEEGKKKVLEGMEERIAARSAGATQPPPVLVFPCIGGPGQPREWSLTPAYLAELAEGYQGIPVESEARKALAWVRANQPKTAKGMPAFLVNWLNRAAKDAARPSSAPRWQPPANGRRGAGFDPDDTIPEKPAFDPEAAS